MSEALFHPKAVKMLFNTFMRDGRKIIGYLVDARPLYRKTIFKFSSHPLPFIIPSSLSKISPPAPAVVKLSDSCLLGVFRGYMLSAPSYYHFHEGLECVDIDEDVYNIFMIYTAVRKCLVKNPSLITSLLYRRARGLLYDLSVISLRESSEDRCLPAKISVDYIYDGLVEMIFYRDLHLIPVHKIYEVMRNILSEG